MHSFDTRAKKIEKNNKPNRIWAASKLVICTTGPFAPSTETKKINLNSDQTDRITFKTTKTKL